MKGDSNEINSVHSQALLAGSLTMTGCGSAVDDLGDEEVIAVDEAETSKIAADQFYTGVPSVNEGLATKLANSSKTTCPNWKKQPFCMINDINLSNVDMDSAEKNDFMIDFSSGQALVQGRWVDNTLQASKAYNSTTGRQAKKGEAFYRVTDNGRMCVVAGCPIFDFHALNVSKKNSAVDVDLNATGATKEKIDEASAQMTSGKGLIVLAKAVRVPSTMNKEIKVTKLLVSDFYLPVEQATTNPPNCVKQ